jgi:serine/threonine protein kinase
MTDFFQWLSNNPTATNVVIIAFGIVIISMTTIYIIAFFQGRSISFYPPSIGEKPNKAKNENTKENNSSIKEDIPNEKKEDLIQQNPIIQKGIILKTASGEKITIQTDFYGGATATLYKAKSSSNENVIVKVFWRGLMPNSQAWSLFSQEQKAAEILIHRNIVKTIDRGLQGGYPFIVMEYFGGGTLRDWLTTHDRLTGQDIFSIAGQVADAIDFAHSHGVIHRDIKPGNILFESNPHGRIALGDFGVAKIFGAVERDITAADNEFVGSPGYLAPETFDGREISKATDIYSFGVTLFEMITGKIPFDEFKEVYAILQAKILEDAPDIRKYRRDVPIEIAEKLAKTLSRNPIDRPESARDVLSGIESSIKRL